MSRRKKIHGHLRKRSTFRTEDKYALTKEEEDRLYELQNRDNIKKENKEERIKQYNKSDPKYFDKTKLKTVDHPGYVGGTPIIPGRAGLTTVVSALQRSSTVKSMYNWLFNE